MKRDTLILAALTLVTTVISAEMARRGLSSWMEAASFVTGAVCVWLTVKESVWNFPISLVNVATFFVVFLRVHLFADMSLQVVYFILTVIGWYMWVYGGENRTALHISKAKPAELSIVILAGALMTAILWWVLNHVGGSVSFWDALTTSISLCAQWLLNKKRLENWHFWILADVIYVPLYLYKGLWLTCILYGVFLIMAIMGLLQWQATHRAAEAEPIHAEALQ